MKEKLLNLMFFMIFLFSIVLFNEDYAVLLQDVCSRINKVISLAKNRNPEPLLSDIESLRQTILQNR